MSMCLFQVYFFVKWNLDVDNFKNAEFRGEMKKKAIIVVKVTQ